MGGKRTKRQYWRRIRHFRRRSHRHRFKWVWGFRTRKRKGRFYRLRVLMKHLKRKGWRPTKRSYYRRCGKACKKDLAIRRKAYKKRRSFRVCHQICVHTVVKKGKKVIKHTKKCKTVCMGPKKKKGGKKGKKGGKKKKR